MMNLFLIHQARLCCRFVRDFMESHIAYFWNELSDRYPQWQGAESSFAEAVSLLVGCVKNHGKKIPSSVETVEAQPMPSILRAN